MEKNFHHEGHEGTRRKKGKLGLKGKNNTEEHALQSGIVKNMKIYHEGHEGENGKLTQRHGDVNLKILFSFVALCEV